MTRREFRLISGAGAGSSVQDITRRPATRRHYKTLQAGGAPVIPLRVYADYFQSALSGSYQPALDVLESYSGSAVTEVLPASTADLADCGLYCLGCFGRAPGVFPQGRVMTLDSTERGIVADWVNAGGKLLCCVDYKTLYDSRGFLVTRNVDSSFFSDLATLISDAGGSLTFGAEDSVVGGSAPWPKDTFLSDAWTSGIAGEIEYDFTAGSSITNGTQLFAPNSRNTIVKEQCGAGWVVVHGSQNSLWGNKDVSQGTPTGYTAMTEFLQFLWDL